MKSLLLSLLFILASVFESGAQERLGYHEIKVDGNGAILPWCYPDPARSYDEIITKVWNFWDTMRVDRNGIPYYMNHQVWREDFNDPRGIGGDQIQMTLSSWHLLYQYTGHQRVKDNMRFLADYYISHSLSPESAAWPALPFPYNTLLYAGTYNGDMVLGKDFTQPDKAGSMGFELVELYKMMSAENYPHTFELQYLAASIAIANTLAAHISQGGEDRSPLPFKVNALNGKPGILEDKQDGKVIVRQSVYCTNWAGTIDLFLELIKLKKGNTVEYQKGVDVLLAWMKKYPMKNNKWGPFFEDVPGWSDTQINAMTWSGFIMNHRDFFPAWKSDVSKIIAWVDTTLGNDLWKKFRVIVINEQTSYKVPGNSHTARQAADQLLFASLSGETRGNDNAIRQLNWATYWVDNDGKNQFPTDDVWLTDGYGDFVRHFLRAMAAMPSLAPSANHVLSSTSIIQEVAYAPNFNRFNSLPFDGVDRNKVAFCYRVFDLTGIEIIRMSQKPGSVLLNHRQLLEISDISTEGYQWTPLTSGGVLTIHRKSGNNVFVLK